MMKYNKYLRVTLIILSLVSFNGKCETLVLDFMADPDVYVHTDGFAYLTGSSLPGHANQCEYDKDICIYKSNNLNNWSFVTNFDPSDKDPSYDYCNVWAPDIIYYGNTWFVSFTARRVANGTSCNAVNETHSSIYVVSGASLGSLSAPVAYRGGEIAGARSWLSNDIYNFGSVYSINDCPDPTWQAPPIEPNHECMRLDVGVTKDGANLWIPYVWYSGNPYYYWQFTGGNSIAIINNANPNGIYHAVDQYCNSSRCFHYEQGVNEAPDLLKHFSNNNYYLFYSSGYWDEHYAVRYLKNTLFSNLKRQSGEARPILIYPHYDINGEMIENRGSVSAIVWGGQIYLFYHKNPGASSFHRSVYWEGPLQFDADDEPYPYRHLLHNPPAGVANRRLHRSGTNYCLDNPNSSWDVGLQLRQHSCLSGIDGQRFDLIKIIERNGSGDIIFGPYYMFRNRASGYCMDIENNSTYSGARIVQWHCHGADNQLWEILGSGGSSFKLKSRNNPALCASTDSYGNLVTGNCSSAVQWAWESS